MHTQSGVSNLKGFGKVSFLIFNAPLPINYDDDSNSVLLMYRFSLRLSNNAFCFFLVRIDKMFTLYVIFITTKIETNRG